LALHTKKLNPAEVNSVGLMSVKDTVICVLWYSGKLFNLLFQIVETLCVKELRQSNAKPIAQLFDCQNFGAFGLTIQYALDSRLRYSSNIAQSVWRYVALTA